MQLNFRQYSEAGAPLIILHGLFGSLGNWGAHSKYFSEQFAVIGVDLRNHGESPHDVELNYPVMAQDVLELMEQLNIASANFIGHSMGGKVAMELALSAADKVDKLLVVDIAPVDYPEAADGHLRVIDGMKALDFDTIGNRKDAESFLEDFIIDEPTRKFVLTNLERKSEGKYGWRLNLGAIEKNYNRLREKPGGTKPFSKPTLFVKGSQSNYIQEQHKQEILQLFPNAQVKIIMQAGHWLHADKPQAFQKIALDFLQAGES
ncbi:MAG: alpha/beta fold hydrolase [Pseudomonadales bacterium]|nr:alpha/beta fold hydrolase [Pseudomonadales bacterium]